MRTLRPEELELVAGGYDTGITVTAPIGPGDPNYDPTGGYGWGGNPWGGYNGGSGGSSGGGDEGSGIHAPAADDSRPAHQYTTPGNSVFTYRADLNQTQLEVAAKISDYAVQHNLPWAYQVIAENQAFYESSLGTQMQNGSHQGLFQYDSSTWSYLGHGGANINSVDDQIVAMYQDIATFASRYAAGQASGDIPASLNFSDYVEVKHHAGPNSVDWGSSYIAGYESSTTTLGFWGD
ncbi:hypothetical protein EC912_108117 [Luteibacter rhizovicinus]|uniref:Transglycosylase SLT domain-containing protein n=1 Tax=Luteibacter rhizovicinus TaxID=242606 RepID=A0A4R3YMS0_9GAMM|nr:hypothetical protein [Luteibacter rhizovicinus]TCV92123.1 hypothetical protein EC912_108117 [Luteibacter rhizovicinus]